MRFLLKDGPIQHLQAKKTFLSGLEGRIQLVTSLIVFFEIYWVLSSYYKKDRDSVGEMLIKILNLNFIELKERPLLFESILLFKKTTLDLEDCYNYSYAKSLHIKPNNFKTFDKQLLNEYSRA